jgi:hypothetical protein
MGHQGFFHHRLPPMKAAAEPASGQAGVSIIEMVIATFVGLMALLGVLFIYRAQSKGVAVQGSISEMRMNAQFTLNEVMYYLAPAGLGLPDEMEAVDTSRGDLLVNTNSTKKSAPVTMDAAFLTAGQVKYFFNASGDTALFKKKVYVALQDINSDEVKAKILKVIPGTAAPSTAYIILSGNKANFNSGNTIYPLEVTRLHVCTGAGADTVAGYFRVLGDNPFLRAPAVTLDSLTLAEGIDSLGYAYWLTGGTSTNALPSNLDNLQRIEIVVRAKTLLRDAKLSGDGYHRQTMRAKVNYRRSF